MNLLKKLRSIPLLAFVCICLLSASVTSCGQKGDAGEENAEHPAEEAEHPAGEPEHPTSDSTKVDSTTNQ